MLVVLGTRRGFRVRRLWLGIFSSSTTGPRAEMVSTSVPDRFPRVRDFMDSHGVRLHLP